jgi:cold shock CspA family protein
MNRNDSLINNLFVVKEQRPQAAYQPLLDENGQSLVGKRMDSHIHSLKNGYGFITFPPNNLYFHWTGLTNADFNELSVGDFVEFTIAHNDRGQEIAVDVTKK